MHTIPTDAQSFCCAEACPITVQYQHKSWNYTFGDRIVNQRLGSGLARIDPVGDPGSIVIGEDVARQAPAPAASINSSSPAGFGRHKSTSRRFNDEEFIYTGYILLDLALLRSLSVLITVCNQD